ncbi:hypothetical protein [Mycolicibacterium komossense]|uniref:Uncharacterized protein n=1 Tax=Mycolicibacterium komossense TaxID=1779 RepID=A0ABT3CMA5_9MYCO|nr:hypothetical protein [Mycolicibacterium komossense]MCV7230678.1 hypothetical protein [Mycolicibacterium komossense]
MSKDQTTEQTDTEAWLDNLDVDPAKARDARHMRRIAAAAKALAGADAELDAAVAAAREAGDSWAMIGTALGVSRQAAAQRFGKVAP